MQLWPATLAVQTPATLDAVRSAAPVGALPSAGSEATCVFCGATGNCDGSVGAGDAGGGSWLEDTVPEGEACNGSGCAESMEEKRVLEHPLASSAAPNAAIRPVLKFTITTSTDVSWAPFEKTSLPTKMVKVAEFQPDMVKIGFCIDNSCKSAAVGGFVLQTGEHNKATGIFPARIQRCRRRAMIKWILILLIVAAAASLLGMPALAGAAATGARILIGIVLVIFLLVVLGLFALT